MNWKPISEAPASQPLYLYCLEFVDEDFNPSGVVDGYIEDYQDVTELTYWRWNGCQDCYDTIKTTDLPDDLYFAQKVRPTIVEDTAELNKLRADVNELAQMLPDYTTVELWSGTMGSYHYYVGQQVNKAILSKAPYNAIYERDGHWHTVDAVSNPAALQRMKAQMTELAKKLL